MNMAWRANFADHRVRTSPAATGGASMSRCRQKQLQVDRPSRCGTIAANFRGHVTTLMRGIRILTIFATAIASATATGAQIQSSREAFYRCKDAKGQTHYGDRMPPSCNGLDTEVLNAHGTVLRVLEGDQTRASRLSREASESTERKAREQRLHRDRMLLETYLSVEDIERLRDQRLEQLRAQYRLTEQTIVNLRERQNRLQGQIARFKPYSSQPGAPPLPDHLAEEMVNSVNGLRVYQESLTKNRAEQAEVNTTFGADIKRFKELKGVR
jgi:hypothetical protein